MQLFYLLGFQVEAIDIMMQSKRKITLTHIVAWVQ